MSNSDPYRPPRYGDAAPRYRSQLPGILLVGIIAVAAAWMLTRTRSSSPLHDPKAAPRSVTARGDLAEDEKSTIEIFREAAPSVVYITNLALARDRFSFDVFEIPQGAGSGFVYDSRGYIVTNYHVVRNANALQVTLADHSVWEGEPVGNAADKDIAVVKIDAPADRLKPLAMGSSSDLVVGQKVFAIGNPFGLDQTLTTGIVSALGRDIKSLTGRPIHDVIQTDAAINPGNSGGPLLDSAGRLIGVNTQIATPTGGSVGIGFAVPVDIVNRVVPEIIRHGKVIRPGLGVSTYPDNVARQLGLEGVLISEVREDSAGGQAGLRGTILTRDGQVQQLGDVIVEVEGLKTPTFYKLLDALDRFKVGEEVSVTFERGGKRQRTQVRLQGIE